MIHHFINKFHPQMEFLLNSLPLDRMQYIVDDHGLFASIVAGAIGIISTIMDI